MDIWRSGRRQKWWGSFPIRCHHGPCQSYVDPPHTEVVVAGWGAPALCKPKSCQPKIQRALLFQPKTQRAIPAPHTLTTPMACLHLLAGVETVAPARGKIRSNTGSLFSYKS